MTIELWQRFRPAALVACAPVFALAAVTLAGCASKPSSMSTPSSTSAAPTSSTPNSSSTSGSSSYAENPLITVLAKQVGTTIYVPTSIPGNPAVTSASPFGVPALPGVSRPPKHYMIEFGNALSVFITSGVAPSALPHGAPSEQSFVVPEAGNADAVVYQSAVSKVPPETTYEVVLNVGTLSEEISSALLTEGQMLAIGKSLAPVALGA